MSETNNLFAYGTLMWAEVLESVTGRRLAGAPATLDGYVRLRLTGAHYPAIVPSDPDGVEGRIYRRLTESDFRHLDRFEGEEYDRITASVEGLEVQVYVLSDRWRHLAEDSLWHPEQLGPGQLAAFCREYKGWRALGSDD